MAHLYGTGWTPRIAYGRCSRQHLSICNLCLFPCVKRCWLHGLNHFSRCAFNSSRTAYCINVYWHSKRQINLFSHATLRFEIIQFEILSKGRNQLNLLKKREKLRLKIKKMRVPINHKQSVRFTRKLDRSQLLFLCRTEKNIILWFWA